MSNRRPYGKEESPRHPHGGEAYCGRFHRAVELIGRRWTGAILFALRAGADRYSDIRGAVPGLSDRLLNERLRELEAEGIIERTVLPEVPPAVRYRLALKGDDLWPVLESLAAWSHRWARD